MEEFKNKKMHLSSKKLRKAKEDVIIESAIKQYCFCDSEDMQYEAKKYIMKYFGNTTRTGEIIKQMEEARELYLNNNSENKRNVK